MEGFDERLRRQCCRASAVGAEWKMYHAGLPSRAEDEILRMRLRNGLFVRASRGGDDSVPKTRTRTRSRSTEKRSSRLEKRFVKMEDVYSPGNDDEDNSENVDVEFEDMFREFCAEVADDAAVNDDSFKTTRTGEEKKERKKTIPMRVE